MFNKNVLKSIACVVIISYISMFSASSLSAAEWQLSINPQLFAQASTNPATSSRTTPEEEKALRQIYSEKIQRFEAEMNSARGTRNTLLTVAVTSFFMGAGIIASSSIVNSAIEDNIPEETERQQQDKDKALDVVDAVKIVGGGVLGVGAASLLGYFIYTGIIGGKQNKIDKLRTELDNRFQTKGLTPEYLQKNESVAAVIEEIEDAKKSAGSSRTLQGLFSRVAIGSLLSGGFLFILSTLGEKIVEEIEINENDPQEVTGRNEALDQVDNIETTGLILLGAGAASGIAAFLFGQRAKGKENKIDELENSLLRVAGRIDIQPKSNGFMVMYTHEF